MQKTKEKTLTLDYAAIDAAIVAAAKAITAATSAVNAKNLALNTLYLEDMKSAVASAVFHADGRVKSLVKDKTRRALLLSYIWAFEAKLLNSSVKKEISERGIVSYKLAIRPDFDKKDFKLPEKLNDIQRDYVKEVMGISAYRGLVPPFTTEKETLSLEELRTKIADLCKKNGYNLTSELKFSKI